MFDLQAGVHLQEIEAAVGQVHQELQRASVDVTHRAHGRHACLAHATAQVRVQQRRRRFLDDLLVAALDGALALAEVDGVTVNVAEDLELDVARAGDQPFQVDVGVAEGV